MCADNFEFAFRIARWVVVLQNQNVPESVDAVAARAALAEILAAMKSIRPARQQLGVIEKAAASLRDHLSAMENDVIDAVKGLAGAFGEDD